MCTSPLHIRNKSVYKSSESYSFFEVPCCKCAECSSLMNDEWNLRLSYEYKKTSDSKGTSIFLTFTYDPKHLPIYKDGEFHTPAFNHHDVKQFLNNLKVRSYRLFGADSYRYFWVSEYGKETQRPHYHCTFFLRSGVNPTQFAELCRKIWKYGFMFPKYDRRKKMYVDNFGNPSRIICEKPSSTLWYVAKYATKDIAFMHKEDVDNYLHSDPTHKIRMKNYLPKHFQSNGIGSDAIKNISIKDIPTLLKKGIFNPISNKYVPVPTYLINKLCYVSVNSKQFKQRTNEEGKTLYERILTPFGHEYYRQKYDFLLQETNIKLSQVFQTFKDDEIFRSTPFYLKQLNINRYDPNTFTSLSNYILSLRFMTDRTFDDVKYFFNGQFDTDFARNLYIYNKDFVYKFKNSISDYKRDNRMVQLHFRYHSYLYGFYLYHTLTVRQNNSEHKQFLDDEIRSYRYKLLSKFDKNYC